MADAGEQTKIGILHDPNYAFSITMTATRLVADRVVARTTVEPVVALHAADRVDLVGARFRQRIERGGEDAPCIARRGTRIGHLPFSSAISAMLGGIMIAIVPEDATAPRASRGE